MTAAPRARSPSERSATQPWPTRRSAQRRGPLLRCDWPRPACPLPAESPIAATPRRAHRRAPSLCAPTWLAPAFACLSSTGRARRRRRAVMQTLAAIQRVWPGRTAAPVDAVTAADDSDPDERRLRPSLSVRANPGPRSLTPRSELAARRADAVEEHHEDVLLAKDANRSLVHLLGSFPVRVAVTIIHLLRRLLDVLGIGGGPTAVAVAERALLDLAGADSPPSYEAATSAAHPPSPSRKRRRWALPRLRPRTNEQTIVVVQPSGGASESESDSAPSRSRASSIDSTGVSLLTASGAGSGGKVALRPPTRSDEKRPVPSALRVLQRPKVLVLDLDETLIHSTPRPGGLPNLNRHWWGRRKLDYRAIEVIVDGRLVVYTVYQRPFVDLFLTRVRRARSNAD